MKFIDLNKYPVNSLPTQPVGSRLTLADVLRCCCGKKTTLAGDFMEKHVVLSEAQRTALIKLAFYVADLRGTQTIEGRTVDEILADSKNTVCPLTLERGPPGVRQSYILFPYDDYCPEAPPRDFVAQMLGVLPLELWSCQREKGKLSNLLHVHTRLRSPMAVYQGAITPSSQQLGRLIVELERRAAAAIRSAGRRRNWELSLKFGESTAMTSIKLDDCGEGSSQEAEVLYAHEYDWRAVDLREEIEVRTDSLPYGYTCHREVCSASASEPVEYRPPLPPFASFVCPAATIINYVFTWNYWQLQLPWFTKEDRANYDMAVYFARLACISSGHGFAKVLASRPKEKDFLPELEADVELVARQHATDARHMRSFPLFEGPVAERTRKRARGEDDVPLHAKGSRQMEAEIEHKGLESAVRGYEAAYQRQMHSLVQCFDGGRGFDLFELLRGWPAVYDVVGETRAKALADLRKGVGEAQKEVTKCVRDIVGNMVQDHQEEDE